MKKLLVRITLIGFIAIAIGYNVTLSKPKTNLTDIMLANVEALASPETGTYYTCRWSDSWGQCMHRLINPVCLLVESWHCDWL